MSELLQLQTLDLCACHGIQELPKLPRSLTALLLTSTSLLTVPNLSYLTNLVELYLSGGSLSMARSDIIQTCDLRWIGKLSKLSKLHFGFPNVRPPTIELGSLSRLKELTLCGLDLPTFKQLPSNLIVLELYDTRGKQVHHDGLLQAPELIDHWKGAFHFPSSLKMLQKIILSGFLELQDIQFVSTLESLKVFSVEDCSSLKSLGGLSNLKNLKDLRIIRCMSLQVVEGIEKLEYLYILIIEECRSMERILNQAVHRPHDPSSITRSSSTPAINDDPRPLKMLKKFLLLRCPEVQDIQFVSTLESLEVFFVGECSSLKTLGGLSNLKNLEQLEIDQCLSLQVVEGIDELEFLRWLEIKGCRSMKRIFDASSSKIPNKCSIIIPCSGELLDSGPSHSYATWESYREMILNGTKQAPDSETEIGNPLQKTVRLLSIHRSALFLLLY